MLPKGAIVAHSTRVRKDIMTMFLGEYEHTIDSKARLAIPAKFRAQIQANRGAVLSKGMGTCLSIYLLDRWEEKSNELVAGRSSEELRDF